MLEGGRAPLCSGWEVPAEGVAHDDPPEADLAGDTAQVAAEFGKKVRLERARDLLASTTMNLSQIADSLGYADAANFTRAFKRWTGLSPSHFRNRELQTAETA